MINFTDSSKLIEKLSGIYRITHISTGKIYIGSTNNCRLRFAKHRRLLRANKHHSKHLQNAYNKYKEVEFYFDILEETSDLVNREQYYLDLYKSYNNKNGYNISPTAGNNTGIVRSEAYKKNKAEVHAKIWYIVEAPDGTITRTRVLRYFNILDADGNKIKETCIKDRLHDIAYGKIIITNYYGWKCYLDDSNAKKEADAIRAIKIKEKELNTALARSKTKEAKKKFWKVYFPDGHNEIIKGLQEFSNLYGLANVSRAAATGMKCKGFRFEKVN